MSRKPTALILRTGGTNCDVETAHALCVAGADADRVHVRRIVDGACRLDSYEILVVPGGFSYGDDVAAGKLLANEIVSRLRDPLARFVSDGKLVLGICNGFQVLVRAGLLPGDGVVGSQTVTLAPNDSGKFECRWIRLLPEPSRCVFTAGIARRIELPVAHAEGKFLASAATLDSVQANGQVVFRYASDEGVADAYPANPNGSLGAVAAICSPSGTVMGMMPHPERFVRRVQHPRWTRESIPDEGDGLAIFRNAVEHARRHLM